MQSNSLDTIIWFFGLIKKIFELMEHFNIYISHFVCYVFENRFGIRIYTIQKW